jgi:hypothetical protein
MMRSIFFAVSGLKKPSVGYGRQRKQYIHLLLHGI